MYGMKHGLLWVGLAACAVAVMGCGAAGTLDTEYVEGVVTLDGTPVADATVMFVPVNPGEGLSAAGQTNAAGVYKLTAANPGQIAVGPESGTTAGEYYVGVMKTVSDAPMSEEEAHEKGVEYVAPRPGQAPEVTHVVPQKYNNPEDSGLRVTVQQGRNTIPIELTSD